MKKKILNEGLDYHDFVGHLEPTLSVDEYQAKMGKDSDIVTLTFIIDNQQAGEDLVNWFERGYDYILDASISDGELSPGKWLVFVEMNRRSSVPSKIIELLTDLQTLTDFELDDWEITIDDKEYNADEETLKKVIIKSPHEYRLQNHEEELNEMRSIAGLNTEPLYDYTDDEIKNFKNIAGL
jgi:hypothetical protein